MLGNVKTKKKKNKKMMNYVSLKHVTKECLECHQKIKNILKQEVADDLRRLLFVWIMFLDNRRIQVPQTIVPLFWKV